MNLQKAIEIFDLKQFPTLKELKKKYHILAKLNHPDFGCTEDEREKKEQKMKEVNAAFDILKTINEEDYLKFQKTNMKKDVKDFITNLTTFDFSNAKTIEEYFFNNKFKKEEIIKLIYYFINKRINYYYEQRSKYFFKYHFDKDIFSEKELLYIQNLCENLNIEYISKILLELDSIIKNAVSKKVLNQTECMREYFNLCLYDYTSKQNKNLLKILKSELSVKEKKELFLKCSTYYQLDIYMKEYVSLILMTYPYSKRTHARKQLLFNYVSNFVGNLIEQKVTTGKIKIDHKNNFSIFDFLTSNKTLKQKTENFIIQMKKTLEFNKIFLTGKELKYCNEILYQEIMQASNEKTIEPPPYVLRKKISI